MRHLRKDEKYQNQGFCGKLARARKIATRSSAAAEDSKSKNRELLEYRPLSQSGDIVFAEAAFDSSLPPAGDWGAALPAEPVLSTGRGYDC